MSILESQPLVSVWGKLTYDAAASMEKEQIAMTGMVRDPIVLKKAGTCG